MFASGLEVEKFVSGVAWLKLLATMGAMSPYRGKILWDFGSGRIIFILSGLRSSMYLAA